MTKSPLKNHWRIIIPLTLMTLIFYLSAEPSAQSTALSLPIAQWLGLPQMLVRKIAHFILFASLGAVWYYYLSTLKKATTLLTTLGSLALVMLYATLDEFHQTFIPGRAGLISDVVLDTTSGLIGIIVLAIILHLIRTKKKGIKK